MPKGQKRDEQDKRDAVSQFESLGGTPDAAKQTAADFGVKATTVRKWARSLNGKKAPKRKTARKAKKQVVSFDDMFKAYIYHRNEAAKYKKALEEELKRELK